MKAEKTIVCEDCGYQWDDNVVVRLCSVPGSELKRMDADLKDVHCPVCDGRSHLYQPNGDSDGVPWES